MQWIAVLAVLPAVLAKSASSSYPDNAITASKKNQLQDGPNSVAVDLFLPNVPGQVHNGMYKQINDGSYLRDLPWVNVYFSVRRMPQTTKSAVKWHFRAHECRPQADEEDRVCSEIVAAELESDHDQKRLLFNDAPHIINRQNSLSADGRRLQFEEPTTVAPPAFATETAYYSCAYSGGGSNWCCAQSNQGSGGPYCWSLSTCREEYSAWNQQNIICCTASAGDCALTYKPAAPATLAPATTTPSPATPAPATEDPFADIPILADTTPPATSAPVTAAPATTRTPVTTAPATEDPFADIPILADTTPPATSAPVTSAPTTTRTPVTSAPTTTRTPVTSAPTTTRTPVTSAPTTTRTPVTSTPATEDPFADIPILADTTTPATSAAPTRAPTMAPATSAPVTAAPATTRTPVTLAPATEDPFADIPILADTITPATQNPATPTPTTQPATTTAPTSSPSITTAPVTAAPVSTTQPSTTPSTSSPSPTTQPSTTSTPATSTPVITTQPSTTTTPTTSTEVPILADDTAQPSTSTAPETTSPLSATTQPSTGTPTVTASPISSTPSTGTPTATVTIGTTAVTEPPATGTPSVTTQPTAPSTPPTGTPTVMASPVTGSPSETTQPISPSTPTTGIPSVTTQPITSGSSTDIPLLADAPTSITPSSTGATPPETPEATAETSSTPTTAPAPGSTTQTPVANTQPPASTTAAGTSSPASSSPQSLSATSVSDPANQPTAQPGLTSQPPTTTPTASTQTPTTNSPVATDPVLVDTQAPAATNPASTAQTPASTTDPATSMPLSTTSPSPTSTPLASGSLSSSTLSEIPSGSPTDAPPSTTTGASSASASTDGRGAATSTLVPSPNSGNSAAVDNSAAESVSTTNGPSSSRSTSSPDFLGGSDAVATIKPSTSADSSMFNEAEAIAEGSISMSSLASANSENGGLKGSASDISSEGSLPSISSTISESSSSGSLSNAIVGSGNPTIISNVRDENKPRPDGGDGEAFHRAIINFTHSLGPAREIAGSSANILVGTAVTANIVSAAISVATISTSAVSGVASGIAGSVAPVVDLTGLFMMLNYLQFISSSSHLNLPTAPDFFFRFTDSLGWCNLQPTGAGEPPPIGGDDGKEKLSSEDASNFTVADGDIISGVLAYAERINVKPEELFTKTAIVFVSVVGSVAAVVATMYSLLRLLLRRKLELLIQRLDDLPRAKLLMRLLIQSCLSICLLSEYALSMTSSFQMRYNEQEQHHGSHSAFAVATVALTVVCCGLIVLGVVKIWNKSEVELSNPDFKFAWGAYYKYYHFENRYFFVAKMGAEILSGVIIGLVSDVPSQLTLLMTLQLAMFLYTIESAPYSMEFQTVCSSIAFVMKMVTYALISSFLTPSTEDGLQNFVGTLVIVLQVTLLVLFNSRQLYILYKQMKYLWELRQKRLRSKKENKKETEHAMVIRSSVFALTPAPVSQITPTATGSLETPRNSMIATPIQFHVAAC